MSPDELGNPAARKYDVEVRVFYVHPSVINGCVMLSSFQGRAHDFV